MMTEARDVYLVETRCLKNGQTLWGFKLSIVDEDFQGSLPFSDLPKRQEDPFELFKGVFGLEFEPGFGKNGLAQKNPGGLVDFQFFG
jgi:hypothetical protein